MQFSEMRLLTVIAPDSLEEHLTREFKALGATGYTILPARGEGGHGLRTSELEGGNIQAEVIVDADTAERMVEHLFAKFLPRHAIVVYLMRIDVVRPHKFVAPTTP
jgi:nitrogen regulatory protein P-II 2